MGSAPELGNPARTGKAPGRVRVSLGLINPSFEDGKSSFRSASLFGIFLKAAVLSEIFIGSGSLTMGLLESRRQLVEASLTCSSHSVLLNIQGILLDNRLSA
jgi:hypothetical protein